MPKRILVAEDEAFLRDIIHITLSDHDLDVSLASNGEEAIKAIEQMLPDMLLLDLLMPKSDGYAVLRHIRENRYDFPVIVLSNLSDPAEQAKCVELGACDFIIKSNLDEDQIWEKIHPHLNHSHAVA